MGDKAVRGRHHRHAGGAVRQAAQPGDHVLCMSNGGFGGIHDKLRGARLERGFRGSAGGNPRRRSPARAGSSCMKQVHPPPASRERGGSPRPGVARRPRHEREAALAVQQRGLRDGLHRRPQAGRRRREDLGLQPRRALERHLAGVVPRAVGHEGPQRVVRPRPVGPAAVQRPRGGRAVRPRARRRAAPLASGLWRDGPSAAMPFSIASMAGGNSTGSSSTSRSNGCCGSAAISTVSTPPKLWPAACTGTPPYSARCA